MKRSLLLLIALYLGILLNPTAGSQGQNAPEVQENQEDSKVRKELQKIFSREEFWWKHDQTGKNIYLRMDWLEKLIQRVREWFHSLFDRFKVRSPNLQTLPIGFIARIIEFLGNFSFFFISALIVIILVPVIRRVIPLLREQLTPRMKPHYSTTHLAKALEDDPEVLPEWKILEEKAIKYFRTGEHRIAVRLMYLAVLSYLNEKNEIRYMPGTTNREYLLQIPGSSRLGENFRSITGCFDRSWYGHHSLGEQEINVYSDTCRKILAGGAAS